jgi:hypothetical protein
MMLIMLSDRLADTMETALKNLEPGVFDIDFVDRLFNRTGLMLPGSPFTLSSHWETWDLPGW